MTDQTTIASRKDLSRRAEVERKMALAHFGAPSSVSPNTASTCAFSALVTVTVLVPSASASYALFSFLRSNICFGGERQLRPSWSKSNRMALGDQEEQ